MGEDPPAPSAQESTKDMLAAYTAAFPDILNATNAGVVPSAQAQLAANQAIAPGLAALQAQIYQAFGPMMGQTADQIAANTAKSQTQSDLDILNGSGKQLSQAAIDAQKMADPEYYKLRESVGGNVDKLLNSIDLSGGLSGGETEAINRGIAQQDQQRGIANTPSQTAVVSNAMKFGQAGYQRKQDSQNQLAQALNVANGALPALKSGVDTFQVVTGRPSTNAADNKFVGVDTNLGSSANSLGGNLLGQVGGLTQQKNDINANRRDSLDRFNQSFSSVVGSL